MDPLSAAASIIAVLQIAGAVLTVCNKYQSNVKHASKEAEQIVSELTSLKAVLEHLLVVAQREEQSQSKTAFSLSKLTAPGGELETCRDHLTTLEQKLQPREGWKGIKDSLTWQFKADEFRKTLDRISKSKETLNLAVTVDNAILSLGIKDDIATLSKSQSVAALNATQQQALDWLMAPGSHDKQDRARRKYQANTGTWFISSEHFANWKTQQKPLLWIHGIPGCGKTILCSSIIHLLQQETKSMPNAALAFYYFDFNNTKDSHFTGALRSLITQLAPQNTDSLENLVKEYQDHGLGRRIPSPYALCSLLVDIIKTFQDVFLVIDALDECQDRDELLDWINEITSLKLTNLHFLMASRKEKDIDDVLKAIVDVQVPINNSDVDPDIKIYVQDRLTKDRKLQKWPTDIKSEIEESLTAKAGGMFRLAECQLDMIGKCNNVVALRKELASLPRSLESTYNRILSEVDESHTDDALKVLKWLSFSARPLILTEIVEALAIDDQTKEYNPDLRFTDPYDIMTICSSLITIHPRKIRKNAWAARDQAVEELRLAHFSVKEYLISDRLASSSNQSFYLEEGLVSAILAETCLLFLHRFKEYNCLNRTNIIQYPFATYAARYWQVHARTAESKSVRGLYEELAVTLLCDTEMCRNWLSLWNPESGVTYGSDLEYIDLQKPLNDKEIKKPLYWACLFGLFNISSALIAQKKHEDYDELAGDAGTCLGAAATAGNSDVIKLLVTAGSDINQVGGDDGTALQAAAARNHEQAVKTLINLGADCTVYGGSYGSALQASAYQGNCNIMSLLIANGADLNVTWGNYGSALSNAADRSHEAAIDLLLSYGVNIDAQSEDESAALRKAAQRGPLRIVKLLIAKGANVNLQTHDGDTALLAAADSDKIDILKYLLDHGADPNLCGRYGGTALMAAAENGSIAAIQLLLDQGAKIDIQMAEHQSALAKAAKKGHSSAVDLLLSRGAVINHSGALQAATASKNLDIVKKLIEMGADVQEVTGEWASFPLETAAANRVLDIVRCLVENGADVNQRGGLYGNALQASANPESCMIATTQYLLKNGAHVDARGGSHESALSAAAEHERDNPIYVEYLLRYGADVNLLHSEGSALYSAVRSGNLRIAEVVLKAGANIEARSEDTGSPLYIACEYEKEESALWLIERGATINSRNEERNDLAAAAGQGLDKAVKLMLEKGADINGSLTWPGSALASAAYECHVSTVILLLENGADPNVCGLTHSSAVHVAAASESLKILQFMVAAGGDPHRADPKYGSVLYAASLAGEDKNVAYLLSLGVDVNVQGGEHGCAIVAAAYDGHRNIVKMLMEAGARLDLDGGESGNVLEAAAQAYQNSETIVRLLLDRGLDPNMGSKGTFGRALQAAAHNGNTRTMQLLISAGADVNARSGSYGTALLAAARYRYTEIVDLLLENDADIHINGPRGTFLYHAASGGDEAAVRKFLDSGLDVNSGWGEDGSALNAAIDGGHMHMLNLLLERGINLEQDALFTAVHQGNVIAIERLLDAGMELNAPIPLNYKWLPGPEWKRGSLEELEDESDAAVTSLDDIDPDESRGERTPPKFTFALHEALAQDYVDVKRLIISKCDKSIINRVAEKHGTALHVGLASSHFALAKELIDAGADPLIRGGEYDTTLQAACSSGELKKVKLVLTYRPDVNLSGGKWGSAIQAASRFGHADIVKCLLEAGADPNLTGGEFISALQAASYHGHFKVAELLIKFGADVNAYDEKLGDCLQAAASQNQIRVVTLLGQYKAIGDRQSTKYSNALQAATDGGYMKTIHVLFSKWACFRKGNMLEKAIESLRERRHDNMAEKMQRSAVLFGFMSLMTTD